MTVQEAIKELQVGYLGDTEEIVQAKHMGISALEKQKAKKAEKEKYFYGFLYRCPVCKKYLRINQKHCEDCGQKLDWEEGGTSGFI